MYNIDHLCLLWMVHLLAFTSRRCAGEAHPRGGAGQRTWGARFAQRNGRIKLVAGTKYFLLLHSHHHHWCVTQLSQYVRSEGVFKENKWISNINLCLMKKISVAPNDCYLKIATNFKFLSFKIKLVCRTKFVVKFDGLLLHPITRYQTVNSSSHILYFYS